jgi:hypothetical protein
MDAGAHGGQVVCEMDTALKLLQSWGVPGSRENSTGEDLPAAMQQQGSQGGPECGSRNGSTRQSLANVAPAGADAGECKQARHACCSLMLLSYVC